MRVEDIIIQNADVFNDNDEHELLMKFFDGYAVVKECEDEHVPFHLVYPTLREVYSTPSLREEV